MRSLNGYQVPSQDRGPPIFQFSDQRSSPAVILITSFLEKFMAKSNCLLLKVFYEGVHKVAGWSGHWEVYCWSHVLKTHLRPRFHWNNFCVSEVFRKTESLLFRKTSGVYLSWEGFFSSGAHHEENPVGTGTFVIANLLYCLVLWLMDMGLFFGAGVLWSYHLLTLLREHQSVVSVFDE